MRVCRRFRCCVEALLGLLKRKGLAKKGARVSFYPRPTKGEFNVHVALNPKPCSKPTVAEP